MKTFQYLRCPVCGKLSRARNYHSSINHNLEIKINEMGGKSHIKWLTKEPTREILYMLYLRVKSICTRLELTLGITDYEITPKLMSMRAKPMRARSMRVRVPKVVFE